MSFITSKQSQNETDVQFINRLFLSGKEPFEVKLSLTFEGSLSGNLFESIVSCFPVHNSAVERDIVGEGEHLQKACESWLDANLRWVDNSGEVKRDLLYKVLFEKPISHELIFSLNLSELSNLKIIADQLQYLHKDEVLKKGLDVLWDRHSALSPKNLSKLLFSDEVVRFLKKELKKKYNIKFDEVIIENAVKRIAMESVIIEDFKPIKRRVSKNIDNPINDSQI